MTPLFTARRKAKRPGPSTPREPSPPESSNANEDDEGPVVVRKPVSGVKNKSKLRTSQVSTPTVQTPRVQSTNATPEPDARPSTQTVILPTITSISHSGTHENDASQPRTLAIDIASKFGPTATSSSSNPSGILNPTQIAERKARRARLAKESQAALLSSNDTNPDGNHNNKTNSITHSSDFISLDAYDSDGEFKPSRLQMSTYLRDDNDPRIANAQEFTRLIPEDEDIAEGFESFVEADNSGGPNRLNMSMKIDAARDRQAIRHLIDRAEGHSIRDHERDRDSKNDSDASHAESNDDDDDESSGNGSSDSDTSQTLAYTTAQTLHGTSLAPTAHSAAQRRQITRDAIRPRPPEKTTTIPTLTAGLARLRELQGQAEMGKKRAEVRLGEIERRLGEVEEEKGRIQRGLEEVGRELAGVGGTGGNAGGVNVVGDRNGMGVGMGEDGGGRGRGLDDIGGVV